MIQFIKILLYRTLSLQSYLKCLHKGFFIMYDWNILRSNSIYKYHYYVKNLINEGDSVVDIGANLGYYSVIFRRIIGSKGQLISIEPMPPFFSILEWALKSKSNVTLYNYALGTQNSKIDIVQPTPNKGLFRTGLSHIASSNADKQDGIPYNIDMKKGSELLSKMAKINFIKMDIEGYEEFVLPELASIIELHKPILQIETDGAAKAIVFDVMKSLDYVNYSLYNQALIKDFDHSIESGDYLFFHKSQEEAILKKISNK